MNKTMTLSFKTNLKQTNIRHNNREFNGENNLEAKLISTSSAKNRKYNIQIFKRDISDVYHDLFDGCANAYNTKQKEKIVRF